MYKYCNILFVVLSFLLSACQIKDPASPIWEIDLNVPLLNKEYPIIDLVNDENFGVIGDSIMFFYSDGEIQGADISEGRLKISANYVGTDFLPILRTGFDAKLPVFNDDADGLRIVSATIRQGLFNFTFENLNSSLTSIIVTFDEIVTENEQLLEIIIPVQSTNFTYYYDLTGHRIIDINNSESILENLNFSVTPVFSNNSESFLGEMKINYEEPIFFRRVRGLLDDFIVEANTFVSNIVVDYPVNIENAIYLNEPKLVYSIYNHIGFDAIFKATVTSINNRTGQSFSIDLEREIFANQTEGDSTLTILTFTQSVENLLNIAPDVIEMKNAHFYINNPDNKIGFALEGNAYSGSYRTTVPFDFSFKSGEPVTPKELITVEISDNNREDIEKRVSNLFFNVSLKNYFSVGAQVRLYLCSSDDYDDIYVDDDLFSDDFNRIVFLNNYVEKADLHNPYEANLTFRIPDEKVQIFHKFEKIYFGIKFDFDEGESSIHPSERIDVIASLKVKLLIDFN